LTLVYDHDPVGNPATHALVIGVGSYPWLLGGSEPGDRAIAEGMGQLTSPPASARAVADWAIDRHLDPGARLATVDLLISEEAAPSTYRRPDTGELVEVGQPTKEAVVAAIRGWRDRCNETPGNAALFFFCGHGVGRGFDLAMLTRDFGSDPEQPFAGSVWFEGFKEGMRSCIATRQLFFVDACRVHSRTLADDYTAALDPVLRARPFAPGVRQSSYYATTTGAPAFGRGGKASLFTENLVKGLDGLGANDARGEWWVETTGLQRALTGLADEFAEEEDRGLQSPTSGEQVSFDFQRLAGPPRVPIYLHPSWTEADDGPPINLIEVRMDSDAGPVLQWVHPWHSTPDCMWRTDRFRTEREAGARYSWSVRFADGQEMRSTAVTLNPPFRIVEFPRDGIA
jgi:hypothetical protein